MKKGQMPATEAEVNYLCLSEIDIYTNTYPLYLYLFFKLSVCPSPSLLLFLSQAMVDFFKRTMYVASGAPTESWTMTSSHEETYESYRKEYPEIVRAVFDKDKTIRASKGAKSATRFQRDLETILGIYVYAFIIMVL